MRSFTALVRLLVILAAAALRIGPGTAFAGGEPGLRSRIDPLAKPLIEKRVAVGFVVGILKEGRTEFLPYGETARGSGLAPDADTVYEIGSITKVFTGVLLADAVERGLVGLDDPVQSHLPAEVTLPVKGTPMTLAHLAEHTSGLPRLPDNISPADPANPYADYDVERLYAALADHGPQRPPGSYEYSNYGAGLLGHLLALRSGLVYEPLLVERVLGPLGMPDTRIRLDAGQRARLAPPYAADLEPASNWDLAALAGAGGLRSTGRDLLRFAQANLEPPGGPLGRALEAARSERLPIGGGLAIGLGWHIAADHQTRWHDGGTGGYHSWLAVIPSLRLGVVVLANTASERIGQLGELVTRAAAGMEVQPLEIRSEVTVDPASLAAYVGFYDLTPEFGLQVTLEGEQLMVQATGQDRFPVFSSGPGEFFYKVVDARLTFVSGEDGRVDRVILHQGDQEIEGERRR